MCMVWFFALPNALDAAWSIVIKTLKLNLKSSHSWYFQTSDGGHAGGQASDQGVQVVGVGGMGGLDLDSGAGKLNMRMVTVLLLVPVLFGLLWYEKIIRD